MDDDEAGALRANHAYENDAFAAALAGQVTREPVLRQAVRNFVLPLVEAELLKAATIGGRRVVLKAKLRQVCLVLQTAPAPFANGDVLLKFKYLLEFLLEVGLCPARVVAITPLPRHPPALHMNDWPFEWSISRATFSCTRLWSTWAHAARPWHIQVNTETFEEVKQAYVSTMDRRSLRLL